LSDQGSHTFNVVLNTLGDQTISVVDSKSNAANGTTTVDVNAGYTFGVTDFPSSITAGTPGTFTVTALTANGSELSNYSGTVQITSSDPAMAPFTVNVTNGSGSFSATLTTAGVQSLTASDTNNPDMSGSETGIIVNPAAATQLVFTQEPANQNYGSPISP